MAYSRRQTLARQVGSDSHRRHSANTLMEEGTVQTWAEEVSALCIKLAGRDPSNSPSNFPSSVVGTTVQKRRDHSMTRQNRVLLGRAGLISLLALFVHAFAALGQSYDHVAKRPITVADGIRMTREATDEFGPDKNQIAHFSPDGKRFVL